MSPSAARWTTGLMAGMARTIGQTRGAYWAPRVTDGMIRAGAGVKTKTSAGLLVLLVLGIAAWQLTRSDRRADRAEPVAAAPEPVATRPPAAPPRRAKPARPPAIE